MRGADIRTSGSMWGAREPADTPSHVRTIIYKDKENREITGEITLSDETIRKLAKAIAESIKEFPESDDRDNKTKGK